MSNKPEEVFPPDSGAVERASAHGYEAGYQHGYAQAIRDLDRFLREQGEGEDVLCTIDRFCERAIVAHQAAAAAISAIGLER